MPRKPIKAAFISKYWMYSCDDKEWEEVKPLLTSYCSFVLHSPSGGYIELVVKKNELCLNTLFNYDLKFKPRKDFPNFGRDKIIQISDDPKSYKWGQCQQRLMRHINMNIMYTPPVVVKAKVVTLESSFHGPLNSSYVGSPRMKKNCTDVLDDPLLLERAPVVDNAVGAGAAKQRYASYYAGPVEKKLIK